MGMICAAVDGLQRCCKVKASRWFVILAFGLVLLWTAFPTAAQSRSVYWNWWDVAIDQVDTTANSFRVTESYGITFSGTFRFGSVVIPLDRLQRIDNVLVTQNGKPLTASCSERPGTYCVRTGGGELNVTYYFFVPLTNATEKFDVTYTVAGALRVYEGGDQLWWSAIPTDHYGFPIGRSTITVDLPEGFAPREGVDPVVTYGAPTDVQVNGTRVTATATRSLQGDEGISIRVQYPHDPDAVPARWQADFDAQREYEENVLPLINLAVIGASALIAIGGTILIAIRVQTRGRDPEIGPVPELLSEPPDRTPPAVVGALVDETVDMRDIISTLIDLARRGYLVFEESQNEGLFGWGTTRAFTFKRTNKPLDDLLAFEVKLLREVFPGGSLERTLNSMRESFYVAIPRLQRDIYDELVQCRFFERSPDTVRKMWQGLSALLITGALFGGFALFFFLDASGIWLLLPVALGFVGAIAGLVSSSMPAKTAAGAEAAAKWKAFERYLRNLDSFGDEGGAAARFDEYLAYAVAFGIEWSFMRHFERLPASPVQVPPWYFPTYRGGRWGGGYTPGSPPPTSNFPGDLASAGGGSLLDELSGGLSAGLSSISDGLTSMLNNASSVMNSRPRNASTGSSGGWRSGGRSWSGGGFGGGGFSGGGSRGFG